MTVTEAELKELRNELDRLYKNWVVIDSRASWLIEKLRSAAQPENEADAVFWAAYHQWSQSKAHGSFYSDYISKAVQAIDPRWSKTWANYATLLVLEPDTHHMPPVLSPYERDNPPSNRF